MLISSAVVQIGLSDALPPEQGDGKRCPFFALKRVCASKYNLATLQAKKSYGESARSTLVTASLA